MNIIINPYETQECYCRPDTTWERENRDFYAPDCVHELFWTPVIFARISKAGKAIGKKFAGRYYDSFGFGMLMYTGQGQIAFTSCADHTSILPMPLYNPVVLENDGNIYKVEKDSGIVFKMEVGSSLKEKLEDAVCKASAMTSLRIGDFVALELRQAEVLCTKYDKSAGVSGTFCENSVFDFKIVF